MAPLQEDDTRDLAATSRTMLSTSPFGHLPITTSAGLLQVILARMDHLEGLNEQEQAACVIAERSLGVSVRVVLPLGAVVGS